MKDAVLLLAHGAPERIEDVPEYLRYVRGGRPTPAELIQEVAHRYAEIGGASPLTARTREQAEALERLLGIPVYFGMRNWRPFIREALERMQADGIERIVAGEKPRNHGAPVGPTSGIGGSVRVAVRAPGANPSGYRRSKPRRGLPPA